MKVSMLLQTVGLFKLLLNLLHTLNMQERELYVCDSVKIAFNICLCSNTYKLIFIKLGMMLDMTNVFSLIRV